MKKGLLSLLFLTFVCFQAFTQDVKKLQNTDGERAAIEMSVVGNKIIIENAPVGKKIEIFSVIGLKITEIEIKTSSGEYILNAPKGYYILKVNDNYTVRKIAIR